MRNLKRALSLALASVMLLGMMVVGTSAASYPDVDEKDNVEAIEVLNAVKVMIGDRGNFRPDAAVNRHEMAVIMAKLVLGNEAADNYVGSHPFTDVFPWADKYVAACYENGLVSGTSATTFSGSQPLTAVQAAAMMLRALGYKDLSKGATDWRAPVTAMANQIRLFSGVASNPKEQLNRNQVAQLALNTLKSPVVDLKDGTFDITSGEGNVVISGGSREYIVRSSNEDFARAINRTENRGTSASSVGGYTIELGEHLYNGKLFLNDDATDDFGRPARKWEYDGVAIGTYAKTELLRAEYTAKVTGKMLYDLLGASTVKDFDIYVTIDGNSNDPANFGRGEMTRTNTDAVGATGNGVLTQVFVDGVDKEVHIAIINTYLAIAETDYNEKKDEVSLTVYNLEESPSKLFHKDITGPNDQTESLKAAGEDFDVKDVKKDDKFLVTVAEGELKSVTAPEVLSEQTVNSYSKGNYVVAGQQYNYATTAQYNDEVMDNYNDADMKDITYNIVLDKYGYLIGIEENETPNKYLFLTGIEDDFSNLYNKKVDANAIFLDGTMKTITVDTTKGNLKADLTVDDVSGHGSVANTWCTYSVGNDNVYTLNVVDTTGAGAKVYQAKQDGAGVKISSKYVSLTGAGAFTRVYGNDDTVYIDAEMETVTVNDTPEDSLIVKDVKSVTTGVTKVDLEGKDLTTGTTDYEPTNEVYTLHKDNGYIIAVVTLDADDKATSKSYVYVSSDDIHKRDWDATDKEYTWYREVVLNGEFTDLVEVTDSNVAKIDDTHMDQDKWYEVSFDANGHVKNAVRVDFETGANPAGTTSSSYVGFVDVTQIDESVDAIDSTVILTAELTGAATDKLSIVGNTLYTDADKTDDGLYVSPNAKIIVFPNNSDDKFNDPETYTSLDRAVKSLENQGDNFDGYIHALIGKDGVATVVIIDEENVAAVDPMALTVNFICDGTTIHTDTHSWDGTGTASSVAAAVGVPVGYTFSSGVLPSFAAGGTGVFNVVVTDDSANQFTVYVTFKAGATTVGTANQEVVVTKNAKGVGFLTNAGLVDENGDSIVPEGFVVDGTVNELVNADNMAFNVPVKAGTMKMKLPTTYEVAWAAGTGFAKRDNAAAGTGADTDGIDVPIGAEVTVKVAGTGTDEYYILNPVAAANAADAVKYKTQNGTFSVTIAADGDYDYSGVTTDKYHKVTLTANPNGSSSNWPTGVTAVTLSLKDTAGLVVYLKEGGEGATVTITPTGTATAGNAGGAVTLVQGNVAGLVSDPCPTGTPGSIYEANGTDLAIAEITVTVTEDAAAADLTLAYTLG